MKKYFLILLTLLPFVLAVAGAKKAGPVTDRPSVPLKWLYAEACAIVDESGETRVLRGVNRSGLEYDKISISVFAGEFGGGEKDLEWGRQLVGYFDRNQIGWAAWSWVDQPHLTQKDRRNPTAFGNLVGAALLKHAGMKPDSTQKR